MEWHRFGAHQMVLIPSGWDVFHWDGWRYRRNGETFYRETWIGV